VSVVIRPATIGDDQALVSLAVDSPMSAPISLCIERAPSFFALCSLRGTTRTFVAERSGGLVGCISVSTRTVLWDGEPRDVEYVADLKVLPRERRSGIGRALVEAVLEAAPSRLHVWTSAVGNDPLARLLGRSGVTTSPLARFVARQLLPIMLRHRTDAPSARATAADEAELRSLLDTTSRQRRLAPVVASVGLGGVPLKDHLVARRGGRVVAAVATWDASSVKQTRLVRMPRHLRALQRATTLLPRRLLSRPLPAEGALLHHRVVRNATCAEGALDALAELLLGVRRLAAERNEHFVVFGTDARDPFGRAAARMPHLTYRYELRAWHPRPSISSRAADDPLYHDDLALS
jgi:predicted N-acetyltransferase YhbS